MSARKVWLIAKRDFLFNFRRRSYLFTAFFLPIMITLVMGVVFGVITNNITDKGDFKHIGIVDKTGTIITAKTTLATPFEWVASEEQAAAALKDSKLEGYYVIATDFLSRGKVDSYSRDTLPQGLQDQFEEIVKKELTASLGDSSAADRIRSPLKGLSIYRVGSPQKVETTAMIASIILPTIFGLLIFMATMTTSQFLMAGVVEEKENRMMEVMVTTIRPTEMLCGKILGLGALGLLQLLVWGVFGLVYAGSRGVINIGQSLADLQITPEFVALMFVYFILGYLLYGSIMAGLGAAVNAEQEGRQISSVISMVGVIPFIASFLYITDPGGPIPVFLSLFPLTAPTGMILRMSWSSVPPVQIFLGLFLMSSTVVVIVWLSARLFRLGMLSYGKRLGVREVILAFREGRNSIVTASGEQLARAQKS